MLSIFEIVSFSEVFFLETRPLSNPRKACFKNIEDSKISSEYNSKFDYRFIELARNVYKFNDERAKIKLAINNALGSNIKEVKSYE